MHMKRAEVFKISARFICMSGIGYSPSLFNLTLLCAMRWRRQV